MSNGFRLSLLFLLALAQPTHAAEVTAAFDLTWRDYDARETTTSGFVLNREQGDLPGVALALGLGGPLGHWTLQVAHEQGDVVYRGLTQLGLPVRTTTRLDVKRLLLGWSPQWELKLGPVALMPHAGLSWQRIDRAIQANAMASALTEKLDATAARLGLMARLPLAGIWSLQAEGQVSRPLHQSLHVNTFGFYDSFTLRPGARTADRLALGVVWRAAEHWQGGLWVSREHWRFGESVAREIFRDGEAVGSANYPGSRQRLDGLALRVAYTF